MGEWIIKLIMAWRRDPTPIVLTVWIGLAVIALIMAGVTWWTQ
jgi:hypothetical protein